jgi:hypothetical protein
MKAFFASLLLLSACTQVPVRKPLDDVVLVPPTTKGNIPQSVVAECPFIPLMEDKPYSQLETLNYLNTIITLYDKCRTKDLILINTVKSSFNIDSSK